MNTSTITFVGRQIETNRFQEIVESTSLDLQVLYLQGGGGIGKSRLLEQLQTFCSKHEFPFTQIIDLYDTENQFVIGLTNRIANELSALYTQNDKADEQMHPFAEYFKISARAQDVRESNFNAEEARGDEQRAEEQFIIDYNDLVNRLTTHGKHPVLFLDTLDAIQDFGDVYHWLLYNLIPGINNTTVVLAGRNDLPDSIPFNLKTLRVGSFDLAEMEDYFDSRKIRSEELQSSSTLQKLHHLTEGNPLLITLVADWLLQNPREQLKSLIESETQKDVNAKKQFRQKLINNVLRLDLPEEFVTVWYMAHIYHRFDANILAWITEKPIDEASAIIASLSQFPFVKFRPNSKKYQLHDVMRDLVREYVLDQTEDINRRLRRDLSTRMIEYYDIEIAKISGVHQTHNINVLKAEQLYHHLFVNLHSGFTKFNELSEVADHIDDIPFNDLLLGSANWYYHDFSPEQAAIFDMYKGWLAKKLGKPILAQQILSNSLSTLKNYGNLIADKVASSLGHTYKELGQFDKARELYQEALILNENSKKDYMERRKVEAQILNNLGNLLRLQGLVDDAHQYSIDSLIIRLGIQDSVGLANSYFFLGLIVREFGDNNGALQYLEKAESEYLKVTSDISRRKGIANILRIRAYIYNHIREHQRAIELAMESYRILQEEIGTPSSDLADTLDILGRLIRDKAIDDYQKDQSSHESSAIIKRNNALSLAEEYIERGYRMAQKVGDQFKEAESILSYVRLFYLEGYYQKSLAWYDRGVSICREREYNLLLSYYESFAGSDYFALQDYNKAFDKFAWRAHYATRCRSMELGMTMDSIAGYLQRLEDPQLMVKYAEYLIQVWDNKPEWALEERFPQIIKLCKDIKRLASL